MKSAKLSNTIYLHKCFIQCNAEPDTGFFDPEPSAAYTSQQTGSFMTPDMTNSSHTDDDIGGPPPLRTIDTTGVCSDMEEFLERGSQLGDMAETLGFDQGWLKFTVRRTEGGG